MKRLVICCDGTWNELDYRQRPVTNVVKLAQSVLPMGRHPDGSTTKIPQLVFYDEGVGVADVGVASHVEKIAGGALGAGLMRNVEDAYRFIVFNYEPGDDIQVFGFSRGAFTARTLVGLIRNCGILRRDEAPRLGEAIEIYMSRGDKPSEERAVRFRLKTGHPSIYSDDIEKRENENASIALKIGFLGIWDTVGKVGVLSVLPDFGLVDNEFGFHDYKLSRIVRRARHAMALDEKRRNFEPTPFDRKRIAEINELAGADAVVQQWFPGGHGGVGGGGDVTGLSDAALDWVVEGAREAGLDADLGQIRNVYSPRNGVTEGLFAPDYKAPLSNVSQAYQAAKDRNRSFFGRLLGEVVNLGEHRRDQYVEDLSELSDVALRRWRDNAFNYRSESFLTDKFGETALLEEIDFRKLNAV